MADDLDDFFDEIEEVEAGAVQQKDVDDGTTEGGGDGIGNIGENDGAATSEEKDDAQQQEEPPKKKAKTTSSAPIRPRGVVVAAASSVVGASKGEHHGVSRPPRHAAAAAAAASTAANIGPAFPAPPFHSGRAPYQPPLPPGFPPPPPPPPPPPLPAENGHNQAAATTAKPVVRVAAGKVWVDNTLGDWPENDFRIFVGNLSRDVTDHQLYEHFQKKYPSIARAKVVADSKGVSKGYGFVSFLQPLDCAKAIREQDQKWLGSRPIRVKRSDWKDRNFNTVEKNRKKDIKKQKRRGM